MAPLKSPVQPEQEKVLVSWTAPARPFKRRTREFYVALFSFAGILGAVLFLIEGPMPVILGAALIFLFRVLSTVAPDNVEYKLTTAGVRFADQLTPWEKLGRFWFMTRLGADILVFEVFGLPGRLEMVTDKALEPKIEQTLKKYLVHEEVPPGMFDKVANWASKRLPQK